MLLQQRSSHGTTPSVPHPIRIADDIIQSARAAEPPSRRAEADREGRSVAGQANHWARVATKCPFTLRVVEWRPRSRAPLPATTSSR
ncbi:TA system antitoxin ParD family protein [Tsukamurella pulmonis]|uniref:TA system antitoxin ParD family protein n=1 Tax=Tsukamurella pulmonis TaxID=47312 RepID=UPI0009EBB0EC|nr:hypothetical protein DVB88_08120 [Tsukamurella pulmonis]